MQLIVHWRKVAKLAACAVVILCVFLWVLQQFLPVPLWAIFMDVLEMIEDWRNSDNYPNRRTYQYPYVPDYPKPRLATKAELASHLPVAHTPVFRHQLIDESCPRFATFELCAACGIGHKVSEYLFGIRLANAMNATYAIDYQAWMYSKHGDLSWSERMLGLLHGEVDLNNVRRKYSLRTVRPCPIDSKTPPLDRGCNVVYSAPRYPGCCYDTASFGSLTCQWSPFSYQLLPEHNDMLLTKYAAAAPTRDLSVATQYYEPDRINVAWHLRTGDWNPHEGDDTHYRRVAENLAEAFADLPVTYHFLSYYDPQRPNQAPIGFEFLSKLGLEPVRFISDTDTEATNALMIAADVLVGSGSGMVTLPAVYSQGLVLYHERLRIPDLMDEMLPHWVRLYSDGTVDADPKALRTRLMKTLCASDRAKRFKSVHCQS